MPYSRSPATLDARLFLLRELELDHECQWNVEPGTEIDFAQRIREGLYIASLYPDYYPALSQASARFKIVRPAGTEGIVQALRKKTLTAMDQVVIDRASVSATKNILSLAEAQAAWERVASSDLPRLEFPSLQLSPDEVKQLHEWASERKLLLFLIPGGGVRLCRYADELAPLAWDPTDLEVE